MIIRSPKRDKFTVLQNSTLQNPAMSWEARGLLAYLLSLPADWKTHVTELSKRSPAKYAKNKRIICELVDLGHIVKSMKRDDKGRFSDWVFDVYDEAQCRSPVCGKTPHTGEPNSGHPDLADQHLQKTHLKKEPKKRNYQKKPAPKALSEKDKEDKENAHGRSFLNNFGFCWVAGKHLDESEALRIARLHDLDPMQAQRASAEFAAEALRGFNKSPDNAWYWLCKKQASDGLAHTELGDNQLPRFGGMK